MDENKFWKPLRSELVKLLISCESNEEFKETILKMEFVMRIAKLQKLAREIKEITDE